MIIEDRVLLESIEGEDIPSGQVFYGRLQYYDMARLLYLKAFRTIVDLGNPTRTFHYDGVTPLPVFADYQPVEAKIVVLS